MANIKAALPVLNAPYALSTDTSALEQFVKNDNFLQYQSPADRRIFSRMFLYFDYVQRDYNDSLDRLRDAVQKMDSVVKPGPLTVSGPEEILAVILSDDPLSPPLHRDPVLSVPLAQACQNKDFLAGFYAWETVAFQVSVLSGGIEAGIRRNLVELGETVPDADISATE